MSQARKTKRFLPSRNWSNFVPILFYLQHDIHILKKYLCPFQQEGIFFLAFCECTVCRISNFKHCNRKKSIYIYKHHFIECNWNDFSFSMLQTHNTCGYATYMQSIKALLMSKLMLCYKCNPYANIIMYLCKYCN